MIPEPPEPDELAEQFPTKPVAADTQLFRVHLAHREPNYYSPDPLGRYSPPPGVTSFGTCYVGRTPDAALVETFGRRVSVITERDLAARELSALHLAEDTNFADMTHPAVLGRFGLTGEASAGGLDSYPLLQRWAHALSQAGFAGVHYACRHDPLLSARCLAVFGDPGAQPKPLVLDYSGELTTYMVGSLSWEFRVEVLPTEPL